jgi:Carboxypeptidase regulatory-like domain/TonB dependent receptor
MSTAFHVNCSFAGQLCVALRRSFRCSAVVSCCLFSVYCVLLSITSPAAFAQTETATLSGAIQDPNGAVVPYVEVTVTRIETNAAVTASTNGAGIYVFPSLQPGHYHLLVRKPGFKEVTVKDFELHVQDKLQQNFRLMVGSVSESITVTGGAPLVNTEDGSVSTVIDRRYVENLPLNGRSFQGLILLTPGVTTSSPQSNFASLGDQGEFSVNGQRTESNYYSVDGVSANTGSVAGGFATFSSAASGSLPGATALGTTQGLVSVDALEEFRIQSSSYSAEFGRNPGGQFSFLTRSGTNGWHGTAFDYVRNGAVDANDWFNDYLDRTQPPVKQNDFGGTLGGPVRVPGLYNGTDKTFFFFSYEGLRVVQPHAASINVVPDLGLRQAAPLPLQQVLNTFPLPNGTELGNGLAQFISSWSNPSEIDASSIRLDHRVNDRVRLFFRFSDTPSGASTRLDGSAGTPSVKDVSTFASHSYTFGATSSFANWMNNEFRLNYASSSDTETVRSDNFGGARSLDLTKLQGIPSSGSVQLFLSFGGFFAPVDQAINSGLQRQWNIVDNLSVARGNHQLKFGFDYRRVMPVGISSNPTAAYFFSSAAQLQANSPAFSFGTNVVPSFPLFQNLSTFAQDEWRISPRLNLSLGLRWDLNPAPGVTQGNKPFTVVGSNPSNFSLAAPGTPLWKTTWFNFAPRFGLAYVVRDTPKWETVLRGGGGLFFDTGQQDGAAGFEGVGFEAQTLAFGSAGAFPLPLSIVIPPIQNPPTPPFNAGVWAFPSHLQLPYTIHWNAALQQSMGSSQAVTLSYVGSHAGRLLQTTGIANGAPLPNFASGLVLILSGLTADYDALQMQFQRRLSHHLQALASYTWAHSIDYGSVNYNFPSSRGNSDFDVRHNFSEALSFDIPSHFTRDLGKVLFAGWSVDDRSSARTAFPVTLAGSTVIDPVSLRTEQLSLNLVPGQPIYIAGTQCAALNGLPCPGGRAINPSAFSTPTSGPGNAPRNFVRGFGAWQTDMAVRREFPIHERLKLQFRAEVFNLTNHPNFGRINPILCSAGPGCTFGQATATLAQSLGILNPLYQQGGARSMQFALKLMF